MRTLYDDTFANLNIVTEQELAQFTVTGQNVALIVMVNVDNISTSGGEYAAKLRIDNRLVVPDRKVLVEAGQSAVSFQSRDIVLYENGVLKISLQGMPSDTNVNGRLLVIDTSPVTVQEDVEEAISKLNVTVKPETKVLGVCKRSVVAMPKIKRSAAAQAKLSAGGGSIGSTMSKEPRGAF